MIHQKDAFRDQDGAIVKWFGASIDIEDRKQAETRLQRALDENKTLKDQLFRENIALRDEVDKASMFEEIVGVSPALNLVLARVAKVAPNRFDRPRHRRDRDRQGADRPCHPQALRGQMLLRPRPLLLVN